MSNLKTEAAKKREEGQSEGIGSVIGKGWPWKETGRIGYHGVKGDLGMTEFTLESLAARVAVLESKMAKLDSGRAKKDWRSVVGMFDQGEPPAFIAEGQAIRQAERDALDEGASE